jgi:hypothetical protein
LRGQGDGDKGKEREGEQKPPQLIIETPEETRINTDKLPGIKSNGQDEDVKETKTHSENPEKKEITDKKKEETSETQKGKYSDATSATTTTTATTVASTTTKPTAGTSTAGTSTGDPQRTRKRKRGGDLLLELDANWKPVGESEALLFVHGFYHNLEDSLKR